LCRLDQHPRSVIDFGCGSGFSTPLFFQLIGVESVLGLDVSSKSLDIARQCHGSERAQFTLIDQYRPCGQIDLAFCNGVFHHIPPAERATAVNYIYRSLCSQGLFAFWENNPLNPGTRYIMSRCCFDRDAITLTHYEACQLLRKGGFEVLGTQFAFIFPKMFSLLRPFEPLCSRIPLGAQYQILCRKP
jgi:SAM-dependent methyltransferase